MSDIRASLPSASSFQLDVACAGRQNLLRAMREANAMPPDEDAEMAEYAARGQRIHEARRTGVTMELSESELDAYTKACEFEKSLLDQWMTENNCAAVSDPVQEERLWLTDPITLRPLLSGQLDLAYIAGQFGLVLDLKTGSAYYVPAARSSYQLRIYALLAWKEWPQLKRIRVAFIKAESFGGKLDYADFDENSLAKVEAKVLQVIWETKQPDAPLRAGSWCRFCEARSVCEEAARYSLLPTTLIKPGQEFTKESILELVRLMPIESAATVWKKRKIVETIMDAIEARLKALPDDALPALGIARKEGRKLDTVADMTGAFNALRAAGYSSEQVLTCMKLGKGEVVAMIQEASNVSKAKAEADYETMLGEFIERSRAKPSLVETKL